MLDEQLFDWTKATPKQRLQRAEFLINWFLAVFNGVKAPYRRRNFKGIAYHMEDFLAGASHPYSQAKPHYSTRKRRKVART